LILVCIPARNEEKTIASVIIKSKRHADKIVVCDDGSMDMTGEVAQALGAEVIRAPSGGGYGAALSVLFKRAEQIAPDVMVTLDADGQHNPDDIPALVKPILDREADVVIGSRFLSHDKAPRAYRKIGIKAITRMTANLSGLQLTDAQSGFRAYSHAAIAIAAPVELGMAASTEILLRASGENLRVVEVPIHVRYKGLETSTHHPLYHGLDVIVGTLKFVSLRHPLLVYGTTGLGLMASGLGYGYYFIQIYSAQQKPITNVALLSMAIVTSGLLLLFMAIILFTLTNLVNEYATYSPIVSQQAETYHDPMLQKQFTDGTG
jgi:glycosyltransferase involved in cell wall biosynthesis